MELTQLKYFLDVAETEHMTKSAERLHIAQPSLTKTIHNLERELGVPLFIPKGRNIVLSEYGRYLREKLAPIMEQLDELPDVMRSMAELKNATVHLNVLAASTFITGAVVGYRRVNPDVKFEFNQTMQEDTYDIKISTRLPQRTREKPEDGVVVIDEKIYAALPREKRFEKRESVTLDEIKDENFISLSDARQFRTICDSLSKHYGFSPKIVFESDSPTAVMNMIEAGMGIGFWPEFTWGAPVGENTLILPIADAKFERELVITRRENKTDNTGVIYFFEYLTEYCMSAKRMAAQRHKIINKQPMPAEK